MPTDDIVKLGIQYDSGDVAAFNAATDQVVSKLQGISTASDDINDTVQSLRDMLTSSMNESRDSIQGVDDVVKSLRDSLQQTGEEAKKTADEIKNTGDNNSNLGGVNGLRRTGSAITQLGGGEVGQLVTRLGDIQQVTKEFNILTDSLVSVGDQTSGFTGVLRFFGGDMAALGVAAPLAIAGLAGITLAIGQFQDTIKAGQDSVKEAVANVEEYNAMRSKLTTKEAQAEIEKLQLEQQAADADAKIFSDSLNRMSTFEEQQASGLIPAFDKASAASLQYSGQISALTNLINDGTTALKDAEAAQKAYTDEITKQIDQKAADAKEMRTGSLSGAQDELSDIQTRLALVKDAANAAFSSGHIDTFVELLKQTNTLQDREKELTGTIIPAIQAREEEKKAIDSFIQTVKDEFGDIDKLGQNQKKYNEQTSINTKARQEQDALALVYFNKKQKEETATFYSDLAKKDESFADKKAKDVVKLYADLSKMDTKEQEAELKSQQQLAEQEAQNAQTLQNQIAQIRTQALYDERDAAVNLDAKRIADDQRKATQQVQQAVTTSDNQKKQLEDQEKIRLADMKKTAEQAHNDRLAQGLQSVQDAQDQYNETRQNEIQNFNDKEALQQQQFDDQQSKIDDNRKIEDEKRQTAFNDQQNAITDDMAKKLGIQTTGQATMQASSQTFWDGITSYAASKINALFSNSTPTTTTSTSNTLGGNPSQYGVYNDLGGSTSTATLAGYNPNSDISSVLTNPYGANQTAIELKTDNKNNNYNNFGGYQGFASGGDPEINQPVMAGEQGPELVEFKQPAHVSDAQTTSKMLGDTYFDKIADKIEINGSGLSADQLQDSVEEGVLAFYRKVAAKKSGNAVRRLT